MASDLIKSYNFERNSFEADPQSSADSAINMIRKAKAAEAVSKLESNRITSLSNYMGLLQKAADSSWDTTPAGEKFLELCATSKPDAWRWAVTRALWKYVTPNGTNCRANSSAEVSRDRPSKLFWQISSLLAMLSGLPGKERYLYFNEVCSLYDEPSAWSQLPVQLFSRVLENRRAGFPPNPARKFLGDLEDQYSIPRDNFNGTFNKVYRQTGLFEYLDEAGSKIAISLSADLSPVLRKRLRFVIDHTPVWPQGIEWHNYLANLSDGFPVDADSESTTDQPAEIIPGAGEIEPALMSDLAGKVRSSLESVGVSISPELTYRLLASLAAKRFLILSGNSGSGKSLVSKCLSRLLSRPERSEFIAVGSSWSDARPLLGQINNFGALIEGKPPYEISRAVALLSRCNLDNIDASAFLVLDEMNLSHVERYFADFLSSMESGESLMLFNKDQALPPTEHVVSLANGTVKIPAGLICLGTVNVDETTYMFSPKVLDRANLIEFHVSDKEMEAFLKPARVSINTPSYSPELGMSFDLLIKTVKDSGDLEHPAGSSTATIEAFTGFRSSITSIFKILQSEQWEFGFRTAAEMLRYAHACHHLGRDPIKYQAWVDEQCLQKVLPKLNGGERRLGRVLPKILAFCAERGDWLKEYGLGNDTNDNDSAVKISLWTPNVVADVRRILLNSIQKNGGKSDAARYPLSFSKLASMMQDLENDQYAAFIR